MFDYVQVLIPKFWFHDIKPSSGWVTCLLKFVFYPGPTLKFRYFWKKSDTICITILFFTKLHSWQTVFELKLLRVNGEISHTHLFIITVTWRIIYVNRASSKLLLPEKKNYRTTLSNVWKFHFANNYYILRTKYFQQLQYDAIKHKTLRKIMNIKTAVILYNVNYIWHQWCYRLHCFSIEVHKLRLKMFNTLMRKGWCTPL